MFPDRGERDLSSELDVTQRHQDDYDRRYDVDGGHGAYLPKLSASRPEGVVGRYSTQLGMT